MKAFNMAELAQYAIGLPGMASNPEAFAAAIHTLFSSLLAVGEYANPQNGI